MANANTVITLDGVHAAIMDAIRDQFRAFNLVEAYLSDRRPPVVPACLIELVDFETTADAMDPGTEQLAVTARFAARLLISFREVPNSRMEIRKLAAAFCAWLRLRRFGQPIGPAQVLGAYPDDFEQELDQYECWRVEWTNVLHLGNTIWTDDGIMLEPVYSWAPDIGIGHEDDYKPLDELTGHDLL